MYQLNVPGLLIDIPLFWLYWLLDEYVQITLLTDYTIQKF